MSSAANPTQPEERRPPPAPAAANPLWAFLRALIAWALGLSPLERMRRGAEQVLAEIAHLIFDPEIALLERPLDADDARNLVRLLDLADALVSTYVWGLARQHVGLTPLIGRGPPRLLPRRHAPDAAGILARFWDLHRRFGTAEAKAARLAARFTASDALADAQPHAEAVLAAPSEPASVFAPPSAPPLARRTRPGLLERALAIADWRRPSHADSKNPASPVPLARAPAHVRALLALMLRSSDERGSGAGLPLPVHYLPR